MKISCIAVDDEPLALEKIKAYILRVENFKLLDSFSSAVDALSFLNENKVDVVFLDVQMEELTGIQMIESMAEKPVVILTTAYDKYSIKGYDLNVTDYLLKPYSFQRFLQAVNKAYDALSIKYKKNPSLITNENNDSGSGFMFVRSEGKLVKVAYKDILFIEGMKDYVRIHTHTKRIMTLQGISNLLDFLPEDLFIRIHKSYIVSIDKIEAIERRTVIINEEHLPIGDRYKKHFMYVIEHHKIIF